MAEAAAPAEFRASLTSGDWVRLGLLWLGGFCLRVTLLAVPPVIPAIHASLGLDEKAIGVLTGMPVLLLAAAAIPGSLLIARLGARRALLAALLILGGAGALRGVGPMTGVLYTLTFLMGTGVAFAQPVFPTLVRDWFPSRVGLATAAYSNGLLVGETTPVSLTGPALLPALHGGWAAALAMWSIPVLLAILLFAVFTSHVEEEVEAPLRRWWPDFRDGRLWQVALILAFASAVYFGTNTFLPDYVRAVGLPQAKDPALTLLNAGQLPASLLVLTFPDRVLRRRWPFVACAVGMGGGLTGMILGPPGLIVFWAAGIGFFAGLALILTLTLPPVLASPADVPRYSAGLFTINYAVSFAGPVIGGAAWDLTGRPQAAFVALILGTVVMAAMALSVNLQNGPRSLLGEQRHQA